MDALRNALRRRRRSIERLLTEVGRAAQGPDHAATIARMHDAVRTFERLFGAEERLLVPMYGSTAELSVRLRRDHERMRSRSRRALDLLRAQQLGAFADEAQILMGEIAMHGQREEETFTAGHWIAGDPEHAALAKRFVEGGGDDD